MVFCALNGTPAVAARVCPIAPLTRRNFAAAGWFSRVPRFPYCNVTDTILRRWVGIKRFRERWEASRPRIRRLLAASRRQAATAIAAGRPRRPGRLTTKSALQSAFRGASGGRRIGRPRVFPIDIKKGLPYYPSCYISSRGSEKLCIQGEEWKAGRPRR
jgi:hypothetical protein